MSIFKEMGSDIIEGAVSSAGGPLASLFGDRHGSSSYTFPLNVEDVGQRHFIKFNIVSIKGSSFNLEAPPGSGFPDILDTGADVVGGVLDSAGNFAGAALDIGVSAAAPVVGAVGAGADAVAGVVSAGIDAGAGLVSGALDAGTDLLMGQVPELPPNPLDRLSEGFAEAQGALADQFGKIGSAGDLLAAAKSVGPGMVTDGLANILSNATTQIGGASGGTKESVGDILLYLPFAVNESYQPNWAGGDLGMAGAALDTMSGGVDALQSQLKNATNWKGAAAAGLGNVGAGLLKNDAIKKMAMKEAGVHVDPHFELFFEGVRPRTFTFDFKFAPRNGTEADAIQSIIRAFKSNAAPGKEEGSALFWTYPRMFEIEYWNVEKLHKILPCALTNITVNYGASGTNHTYYDGNPIQTDVSLTFMESELLTRTEISEGY